MLNDRNLCGIGDAHAPMRTRVRLGQTAHQRFRRAPTRAPAQRGRAAIAQARLAYRLFIAAFSGERWEPLALVGARPQRPLWASASTKDPAFPDMRYGDDLIGPGTVSTMPKATLGACGDHGTVAWTVDVGIGEAEEVVARLATLGVELDTAGAALEDAGVDAFRESFDAALAGLRATADAGAPVRRR